MADYPTPPVPSPAPERVEGNVICRRSSYNLRGLLRNGECSECGARVALSLQGDLLRFADPSWLRRVRLGAVLFACGWTAIAAGGFATTWLRVSGLSAAVLAMTASGVLVVGVWLVTGPDPGGEGRGERARREARALMLGAFVIQCLRMLDSATIGVAPAGTGRIAIFLSAAALDAAGELATCWYMGRLAMRASDVPLARRLSGLGVAYAVSRSVWAIGFLLLFVHPSIVASSGWYELFLLSRIGSQVTFVVRLVGIVFLTRFALLLGQQIDRQW